MAASNHVSLPKPFASGNISEWFTRFDICCDANEWDNDKRAAKLPTLLEGEALAVWLDLSAKEKKSYAKVKETLVSRITPNMIEQRKLIPGEALSLFLHDLEQLPDQEMPKLDAGAKEQLIIHQLLVGLPGTVSKQLRAAGDTTKLQATFDRAKLLMSLEDKQTVATVSTPAEKPRVSEICVMEQLVEQVAAFSKQVEALSTRPGNQQPDSRPVRCFTFVEIVATSDRNRTQGINRQTSEACLQWATATRKLLSPHKPIVIAALNSEASTINGIIGDKELNIMLDSGSSVSLIREEALTGMNTVMKDKPSVTVIHSVMACLS